MEQLNTSEVQVWILALSLAKHTALNKASPSTPSPSISTTENEKAEQDHQGPFQPDPPARCPWLALPRSTKPLPHSTQQAYH